MRGTALVILAAALPLTACGGSSPEPSPTTATAATSHRPTPTVTTSLPTAAPTDVPACAPGTLTVSLGKQSGAAGSLYVPIVFTNTGPTPCSLSGYPTVSLATGTPPAPLGPAAEPDTDITGPKPVTLAPTESAHSTLRYSQAANYDCDRTPAQYLLINPPNQPPPTPHPFTAEACTKPPYLLLHLDYLKPGKEN
ncbi:uncharacterized protein DUF4232 [Nocardia tenerifensis]|uniref:Uncharacterized protein DUF4232 n=1 Tax=Nocardia tenerifensis TaxID=228006 RepID=A0A318K9F0_9NOCA|nr:DUF4232 domain-containing protein [Nocardia tenerifensis]PXX68372.1 uncharacterized protein DUF4232 [Nocardia tenerifensis]